MATVIAPSIKEQERQPTYHQYVYHVESPVDRGRVEAFLRAFAEILQNTHYGPVLETYSRGTTRCTRCACTCQIYQTTKNPKDIPCHRSELEEMKGVKVKFSVNKEDVEYVFFPAVSDYLMGADTLMGNAAVLHAAGDSQN